MTKHPKIADVLRVCADMFGIRRALPDCPGRSAQVSDARRWAAWVLRRYQRRSNSALSTIIWGCNLNGDAVRHSTVVSALHTADDELRYPIGGIKLDHLMGCLGLEMPDVEPLTASFRDLVDVSTSALNELLAGTTTLYDLSRQLKTSIESAARFAGDRVGPEDLTERNGYVVDLLRKAMQQMGDPDGYVHYRFYGVGDGPQIASVGAETGNTALGA